MEAPYAVGMECGLDFYACDKMAKKAGTQATDKSRIKQSILKAFQNEQSKGHVYLNENQICQSAKRIIRNAAFHEDIPISVFIEALSSNKTFVVEYDKNGKEAVYLKHLYEAEKNVAFNLNRLIFGAQPLNYNDSIVEWVEKSCNISYAPQ